MLSSHLASIINTYRLSLLPRVEAECDRQTNAAARVLLRNMEDLLADLSQWEASAGPASAAHLVAGEALPANVVAIAKRMAAKGRRAAVPATAPDGGDAA